MLSRLLTAAQTASVAAVAWRGARQRIHGRAGMAQLAGSTVAPPRHDVRRVILVVPLLREFDGLSEMHSRMELQVNRWRELDVDCRVVYATSEAETETLAVAIREQSAHWRDEPQPSSAAVDVPQHLLGLLDRDSRDDLASLCSRRITGAERANLLEELARQEPTRDRVVRVSKRAAWASVAHYDGPVRGMAAQFNHAAVGELAIASKDGLARGEVVLAIYNADSNPNQETPESVLQVLGRWGSRSLLQQSSFFEVRTGEASTATKVARAVAAYQTRWTLVHEIPRLIRQSRSTDRRRRLPHLGHCVGHGLYIPAEVYAELGGLPEHHRNEDLAFGFLASAARIPILSLPVVESADSPSTLSEIIGMYRRWFWAYFEYPSVARSAKAMGLGTAASRTWLLIQGLGRGAYWLATPLALAACLGTAALGGDRGLRVAAQTALALYAWQGPGDSVSPSLVVGSLVVGVGPWVAMVDLFRWVTTQRMPNHRKRVR